jgi:hypothetical protein
MTAIGAGTTFSMPATWYHKFNDRWHTDTEIWYMWQAHTPNVNNPAGVAASAAAFPAPQFTIGVPSGAPRNPAVVYCYSYEWAAVNFINYTYTVHDIFTWRSDFLDDAHGRRSGFKSRYAEFDLSFTHWVGDALELRPELRFERSLDAEAYDNPTDTPDGAKKTQFMLAADMIFFF